MMKDFTNNALAAFLEYWGKYCRLDDGHGEWVERHAKVLLEIKRGDLLFEPGDTHDYLFFVVSGLLAAVTYDEVGENKGLERRLLFLATANFSLLSTRNLYTSKQLEIEIQALRDSVVIRIPVAALKEYHGYCQEATVLINVIREKILKQIFVLAGLMAIKNEVKRYGQFCKRCKHLLENTTQQEQADYLNISRNSINRFRMGARKRKKKK